MRFIVVLLSALMMLTGCTHHQLRRSTTKTSATLIDIQYKQALDNIAMFVDNPGSLPFFALAGGGSVQVVDKAEINAVLELVPHAFTKGILGLGPAGRQLAETWNLVSILSPNQLLRMRCLYQYTVNNMKYECHNCDKIISEAAKKDRCGIPRCFFGWGGKHDIPKNAKYIGSY